MSNKLLTLSLRNLLVVFVLSFSQVLFAQDSNESTETYILGDVSVSGNTSFSPQTIIAYSGLRKGERLKVPGEKISNSIKKLWSSNLFSSIDVFVNSIRNDSVFLEIELVDLPELNEVRISGVRKGKREDLKTEFKLDPGIKVTENLITTTKNALINKYQEKGYYNTSVVIRTEDVVDSIQKRRVNLFIDIDPKNKVKVSSIVLNGADKFGSKKLRKAMKNTKQQMFGNVLKRSKYIEEDFKEDLNSLIDFYKEKGYRDARVVSNNLTVTDKGSLELTLNIEEGEKYKFGKIEFLGNTVYTDEQLGRVLRIREGDTYNGVELESRISDNSKPDADDLTNLYQNNGYLFSTINPVEVSVENNVIDLEIRIIEEKPAYFNKVTVVGNEVTNDHVIYRELRTRPGQLYSKANVVRTVRELGQLGYFDAQQIEPDFQNLDPNEGTLDMEYKVVKAGSSQIELQGGYGGGGFIGTLGLSFSNFAIKDIFNKKAYNPVPMGDGQTLALRLQASRFFETYSFSFSEPWLGGKKPINFSAQISHTKQYLFNPYTRTADKDRRFYITGISFGLAKRLQAPDDYFTLSHSVGYQHYDLQNYNTGLFTFGDGTSNNFSYTVALSRNNTYTDPIYPTGGSNFVLSAKLSPPYSMFTDTNFEDLRAERDDLTQQLQTSSGNAGVTTRIAEIDQERFKWLEFYKVKFKIDWYTLLVDKLVLKPSLELGYLGAYNNARGIIPFERFFVGGDGLGNFAMDGREMIQLRGYPNQSLSSQDGGSIYNKFSLELRYPITLGQQAKIFGLLFTEGASSVDNFRDYNPFKIQRSAGVGVRLFMPAFGLLGIDFGHGFDPIPGETIKSGWQTHFIIGQQF
jgi:outer membrane protein insertion porin family